MDIKYSCPYWGSDHMAPAEFINKIIIDGYDGAEIFFYNDECKTSFIKSIEQVRKKQDFYFIALQLTVPLNESVDSYIDKMKKELAQLVTLDPLFINSHTGKDYFSFDDNCKVIEAAMNFGVKNGIRILHETHRGRFSFHAASLLPYLKKFPEMELVADFSHFCTVSESMLEDQKEILDQIIPHVSHIHARVGFDQAPQVNDPQAPEWEGHLKIFMNWWKQIIDKNRSSGKKIMTVSPEFGPQPYMPTHPYTLQPHSDQWENNLFIMNTLKGFL